MIAPSEMIEYELAATEPKKTPVAPKKPVPTIVTIVPAVVEPAVVEPAVVEPPVVEPPAAAPAEIARATTVGAVVDPPDELL